ncbi:MAG: dienelactone hydrolase family protein [Massilia sp.]
MKRVINAALFGLASQLAPAMAAPPANAETVWIPLAGANPATPPVKLEATLYRPEGGGRAPVVVFNHGSSGGPIPANYTEKAPGLATFLNARGIALLVPMRSGRGQSEGVNNEEPSACTVSAARARMATATAALDASLAYLRSQPWADMGKLALAGHSRGGLLAAAYATEHPGVVRGAINFSGGWKDDRCADPDINVALFEQAGRGAGTPAIFLYAHGDGFYADSSIEKYAQAYTGAGGKATFRFYQLSDVNGHLLFRRAQRLWEAYVEAFLRETGMLTAPAAPAAPVVPAAPVAPTAASTTPKP